MSNRVVRAQDDGFTVVEIVVASAILFFVVTAMVGLVGASQNMSVSAKQRSVVTNATAWYIDRIRSMPYDQLAIAPTGNLPANETVNYGDYQVVFVNRVTYPDGQNGRVLKTVNVTATCIVGGRTYTSSAVVNVKNPDNDRTATTLVDPNMPTVEFDSATPPPDSVLYDTWIYPSGSPISIETIARSPSDKIVEVQYKVGNVLVRDRAGGSGDDAIFTFTPGVSTARPDSGWDTMQAGVTDGFQTVTVIARDDQGRVTTADRRFIVDNQVPGVPGVPTGSASTSTLGNLSFGAAPDGYLAYASRYQWTLYREPSTLVGSTGSWTMATSGTVAAGTTNAQACSNAGPIAAQVTLAPFSRYWATVRAGSPRDWNTTGLAEMATPFVSRPEIYSAGAQTSTCTTYIKKTGSNKYTEYTSVLWLSKPTFPCDSVSYTYQYKDTSVAGAAWTTFIPYTAPTVTDMGTATKITVVQRDAGATSGKPYAYRVGVTFRPTGWAGGTSQGPLWTNAVGNAPTAAGSANLVASWVE